MRYLNLFVVLSVASLLAITSAHAAKRTPSDAKAKASEEHVGRKISDFTLKSSFGKEYSLSDLASRDVVVVVFLGTECPMAKLYAARLGEMAKSYKATKVGFIGIDSNQQDSLQELSAFGTRHKLKFPLLKDLNNTVADQFGAIRTPEAFVLDKDRVVRYWGRIDDQYGFADGLGYQRPEPSRSDLKEAIDELLAGKEVSVPTTDALGCHIGRVRDVDPLAKVTYSNQIARIFQAHCVECHRAGRIGPFEMTSYEEVAGWGEMIREVVDQGRMPPWHADPAHGSFANDMRLTDEEKKQITTWVDAGCPEGDPAQLPKPQQFVEGWTIGEPDQIVQMGDKPVKIPAEGTVDYYHFTVDPGWKEDKWIKAAEARPSAPEVVHHILVFVQPPGGRGRPDGPRSRSGSGKREGGERRHEGGGRGEGGGIGGGNLIAGYAPGMNPMLNTDGKTAMHVKAGSKLVFQLHYTPNGTQQQDRSFVGFKFADPEKVEFEARSTQVINTFFAIPPGAEDYKVSASGTFERDTLVTNFTPHMHTRGKSFRYEVTYPDDTKEILLDVPTYDFNWQTTYQLKEPKLIPKGSKLVCTAHWDNSENNLSNPDPTKTVSWGEQTWEEMMIGFYVEVHPKGQAPARPSGGRPQLDPETAFASFDANGDGTLTKDEVPSQIGKHFDLADLNKDGGVSKEELTLVFKLLSPQRGERKNKEKD